MNKDEFWKELEKNLGGKMKGGKKIWINPQFLKTELEIRHAENIL